MTTMQYQNTSEDRVDIKTALIALVAITLIVAVAMWIASYFNQVRRQSIVEKYVTETQGLISQHEGAFEHFFTKTFAECETLLQAKNASASSTTTETDFQCPLIAEDFTSMKVDSLQDSSSTAYVRYNNGQYQIIEASGKYNQVRSYSNPMYFSHFTYEERISSELKDFLEGKRNINQWQDFITYIQGKEVVVPVVIQGETVGFIFRGVIER